MRSRSLLAPLLLLVPIAASAQQAQAARRAKTIDELAAMFDSSRCRGCHAEIYAQWERSQHARPFLGIADGPMLAPVLPSSAFQARSPRKATLKTFPCFKCHLPQGFTHAEDSVAAELADALVTASGGERPEAERAAARAKVAKLQITCTVCHHEKAVAQRLALTPDTNVLYGTRDLRSHGDGVFTQVKRSALLAQPIFCGQCHGLGPNFVFDDPLECTTLYGSYRHGYVARGGRESCQQCHMRKVGATADHLFAPNWSDRDGASRFLAQNVSRDVQALGDPTLRGAGAAAPTVVVSTAIAHQAGHRIPDG